MQAYIKGKFHLIGRFENAFAVQNFFFMLDLETNWIISDKTSTNSLCGMVVYKVLKSKVCKSLAYFLNINSIGFSKKRKIFEPPRVF